MNGQLAVALTMSVVLGFYGTVAEAMHDVAWCSTSEGFALWPLRSPVPEAALNCAGLDDLRVS
jgi:hypothetical protein